MNAPSTDAETAPQRGRNAFGAALVALVVLAATIRIAAVVVHGGGHDYIEWAHANHFGLIVEAYVDSARLLLDGHGYRELLRPPGQSVFFATMMSVGVGHDGWRIVQSIFDAIAVGLLALAAVRLGVRPALALLVALPVAVLSPWTVGATLLLAEWMAPLAVACVLLLAAMPERPVRNRRWVAIGLVIAASALFRPDLIVLAPLVASVWGLRWLAGRARWPALAALFLATTIPLALWGLHNLRTHGAFVLLSTSGGSALYQGLGAVENEHGYVMSDRLTEEMLKARGMEFGSPEGDRELKRLWREAVVTHPAHALATIRHRWMRMAAMVDRPLGERSQATDSLLWIGWIALPFATWILLRRGRADLALVLWIPLLLGLLATGLTHAEARYVRFVPFTGLLAIGVTLSALVSRSLDPDASRADRVAVGASLVLVVAAMLLLVPSALWRWGSEIHRVRNGWALERTVSVPDAVFADRAVRLTPVGAAQLLDDGRTLVTDDRPYGAAASASIVSTGASAVAVRVRGAVVEGGASIALIDDAGRSLAALAIDGSGPWTLVAGVNGPQTRLAISNRNPLRAPSIMAIDGIDLFVDAASDSPAKAALEAAAASRLVEAGTANVIGFIGPDAWTLEGDGSVSVDGDRVRIHTDANPATYQASVQIDTTGRRWVAVRSRLEVVDGGASLGILDGARRRWLATETFTEPGIHEVTLIVTPSGEARVVLMLSNHRPATGGASAIVIERVELFGAE